MEFEVLKRGLKDSAANSKLKLLKEGEIFGEEKPGGEKRIYIGQTSAEEEWDRFFFPGDSQTVNVTVSKLDLIKYMIDAKNEYLNPKQSYRLNISEFYDSLLNKTMAISQESFQICFKKNTDSRRYYLTRPTDNPLSKNYNYIIDICLPIITNFVFLRIKNGNSYFFYLKPELILDSIESDSNKYKYQQIFYGAPGTGKSKTIKMEVDEKNKLHFRTTFHPDSDYSTFVGAYKPTMKSFERKYSSEELTIKLREIKTSGTPYPCQKFAAKYWESLIGLSQTNIKNILKACDFKETFCVEINKGVAVGQEYLNKLEEGKVVYSFCPQAFTNAYVEAWNTKEEVYLVIEEINRGNCAQIFGDLFQLLDRKNGFSEYPVEADTDLQNYLSKELANSPRMDIPDDVKSGEKLILPSNLYIWATMNTSDQSLFPIDSAFKRRWDWKYIKIKKGRDENGNDLDWKVDVKIDDTGNLLSWWDFISKVNDIIASMTSSADKQLGYFFCSAKDGIIDEETFVSKVIFYLWNDVFKDYGFEDASLFRYTIKDDGKETERDLTYPDFYDEDGEKVNTERLTDFLKRVMNWKKSNDGNN